MRRFPEFELLFGDIFLVHIDAQPRRIGDDQARAILYKLAGKNVGVAKLALLGRQDTHFQPGKIGHRRGQMSSAAVQMGPSGLCGMRSI